MKHWSEKQPESAHYLQLKKTSGQYNFQLKEAFPGCVFQVKKWFGIGFFFTSFCLLIWFGRYFLPSPLKINSASLLNNQTAYWANGLGDAAFSKDGNEIAFYDGVWRIYDIETGLTNIWDLEVRPKENVQWLSPNQLVFQREINGEPGEYKFQFWVLDTETGVTFPLNDMIFPGRPKLFRVSNSGTKLAFVKNPENTENMDFYVQTINVLDLEKNTVVAITNDIFSYCHSPNWLSNDTQLLYFCQDRLWRANIDSGTVEAVAFLDDGFSVSLSPDEKWLAYTKLVYGTPKGPTVSNLYLAPVKNGIPDFDSSFRLGYGVVDNIISRVNDSLSFMFEFKPSVVSWSPDSQHLVLNGTMKSGQGYFYDGVVYITLE